MKLIPLGTEATALLGFTHKLVLDYTDLKTWTSGTAQAVLPVNALGASSVNLPAGTCVGQVAINVTTAFTSSDGAITTFTFSLGDGSSATRFLNAVSLKTAQVTASTNALYAYAAADTIDAVATYTLSASTIATLNAGAAEIYVALLPVTDLQAVK